jgi:hypothetical protein
MVEGFDQQTCSPHGGQEVRERERERERESKSTLGTRHALQSHGPGDLLLPDMSNS